MQKLAIPISIVIAGALIAGAVYFAMSGNAAGNQAGTLPQETVVEPVRTVQADDHILGNPNAEIVIIEYSDTECPYCKQFHGTLQRIIDEYGSSGDVAWVYRHFPLASLHPKAPKEAEALECAAELGGEETFWSYTNRLYEITPANNGLDIGDYNNPDAVTGTDAGQLTDIAVEVGLEAADFESCVASGRHKERIDRDLEEVFAAGGRGTPHNIILIDGEQIPLEGAQQYEVMSGLIETILSE